jgi:hypothetical protein
VRQKTIRILYEDTVTCRDGHPDAHVRVIWTAVDDARPAKVILCFECDRLACHSCKRPLAGYAQKCGCGGPTFRTVPLTRF